MPDLARFRAVHGPVEEAITPERLQMLYGVAMCVVEVPGPQGTSHKAVLPAFAGARAA